MNEKKKKSASRHRLRLRTSWRQVSLEMGEKRGKKERPKDTGIGDGAGLHCGRDPGTQALPQEESDRLSNTALVSCVCVPTPSNCSGQPDQQTPEESV